MPTFEYQPLSPPGATAAVIDAPDKAAAVRMLRAQGIVPRRVEQVERRAQKRAADKKADEAAARQEMFTPGRGSTGSGSAGPMTLKDAKASLGLGLAMSKGEMASFVRELATAVMAGLPLVTALRTIARQGRTPRQKAMLSHLISQVEHGKSLADAAQNWGKPFTELVVSLIRAGEASGQMGEVLDQAANLLDREVKLKRTLLGGLLYPMILAVLIVIAVIVIVTVIVPRILAPIRAQFKSVTLPLPTRVLTGAADFMTHYWWAVALGVAGLLLLWTKLYRTPRYRLKVDRALLRFPMIGKVLREVAVARFTRTLYTLVSAGLPALTALRSTKATLGNKAMEAVVDEVCEQVASGKTIADPMERSGYFPPLLTQIVGVGERSGRLPQMLGQAASVFEERTEASVKIFTTLFTPLIVVCMALVVGFVVLAIILPIIQMQELIG